MIPIKRLITDEYITTNRETTVEKAMDQVREYAPREGGTAGRGGTAGPGGRRPVCSSFSNARAATANLFQGQTAR
ncbi:MAG: hypothetical protein QXG03_13450, partial [Halalkalicoccus sp.]